MYVVCSPSFRRLVSGTLITFVSGLLLNPFVVLQHCYMLLQKVATIRLQLASDIIRHLHSIAQRSLGGPTTILVDLIITSSLIPLEVLDLLLRHQSRNQIRLDLLELEPETLVRVILFVCLILLVSRNHDEMRGTYLVVED
jgi:hypothetical protein